MRFKHKPLMKRTVIRDGLVTVMIILLFIFFTAGRSIYSPMALQIQSHDTSSPDALKLVIVVHRHGARTPLSSLFWPHTEYASCSSHKSYENGPTLWLIDENKASNHLKPMDLDASLLPGGCRMGQLTRKGAAQGKELGQWLRSRYVDQIPILPKRFDSSSIAFRSTMIERAIVTLQGVISSLYPELNSRHSIKVNATDEAHEIEYGKNITCPRLGPIFSKIERQQEHADSIDAGVLSLAKRVTNELLKTEPQGSINWIRLYDSIVAMEAEGKGWPDGLTSSLLSEISSQALRHEAQVVNPVPGDGVTGKDDAGHRLSEQVVRLSIGPLIHRIISSMRSRASSARLARGGAKVNRKMGIQEGPGAKMIVFSGHDSTLSPLLVALGRPFKTWPPFASSLVFELWQGKAGKGRKGRPEVRVLFNREPLVIEGGSEGGWVSLEDLEKLLGPYMVNEAGKEKECKL